jgi:Uma2 family endonuclease
MAQRVTGPPTIERHQERRLPMSYEEFLAWADEDVHAEWVDGEVTVFVPPNERHQQIVGFLVTLLRLYVRSLRLGEVLQAPFEVRLRDSAREPDILFVGREHLDRLAGGKRVHGAVDLAIEVVSESSVTRDHRDKLREYAAAGVPEYWVVDPRPGKERTDFYRLTGGAYAAIPPDADGRYQAAVVPGFWLRPEWLREDPLPDELPILGAIAPRVLGTAIGVGERSEPGTEAP